MAGHIGYSVCESAVITELINISSGTFTSNNCTSGDLDKVVRYILGTTNTPAVGCYIEYLSGYRRQFEPYKQMIWAWNMRGIVLLRTNMETVEEELRELIDMLSTFGYNDHTLGGITKNAFISSIDQPSPVRINDVPYYWLPFVVETWDKG